jgi:GNAT superfamily N-acetyltransferase
MQVESFDASHARDAATIFVAALDSLRRNVPALSGELSDIALIEEKLSAMRGSVAFEDGRLVGYLTSWFPIMSFRDADRTGAYVPAWGHGVAPNADVPEVYRALYRASSAAWASDRCDVHAITLLAGNPRTVDAWFWSGFGLGTIDAVRPMDPLNLPAPIGYRVRAASMDDAPALASLDAEHVRHYSEPPVFMTHPPADDAGTWSAFLAGGGNTAWLAEDADGPFAFIRFDRTFGHSEVTASEEGVLVRGAYVRATHRRRGAGNATLDAALRHYADVGLTCCAVDFEAFNPEAAAFWTRSFTPVCYSLMRVPESFGV